MVSIPSKEPNKVEAGSTWQWTKQLSDYPSPTWTLNYYLRGASDGSVKQITATADGNGGHSITVAASDTQQYEPTTYQWVSRVTSGSEVHTIGSGFLTVAADFANAAVDHRTYNERLLDAIEAVRENRASTDQASMTVNDRSISRMTWDELEGQWLRLRDLVAKERGIKVGRVLVRM